MEIAMRQNDGVFHIGDVIRKLRQQKEWSLDDLAEASGVNRMTISGIERGATNFQRDTLDRVASALGQDASDLYTYAQWQSMTPEERRQVRIRAAVRQLREDEVDLSDRNIAQLLQERWDREDNAEPTNEDVAGYTKNALPVVAEGDASPQPNMFWDNTGVVPSDVEDRITRPHDVRDPRAYGVKVRGDSMAPAYRTGMIVVVSPSTPVADGDEVYVELLSGERLLKVARKMPGGWLLESYNPAHGARFVEQSEVGSMHVVLWARRNRRGERFVRESK